MISPYGGLDAGAWHNVILNVDRDVLTTLYVDGAVFGHATSSIGSLDGLYNLALFNDGAGAYASRTLTNLMIDEFSAWNRQRTAGEVAYLSTSALNAASVPEPAALSVIGSAAAVAALRRQRRRS